MSSRIFWWRAGAALVLGASLIVTISPWAVARGGPGGGRGGGGGSAGFHGGAAMGGARPGGGSAGFQRGAAMGGARPGGGSAGFQRGAAMGGARPGGGSVGFHSGAPMGARSVNPGWSAGRSVGNPQVTGHFNKPNTGRVGVNPWMGSRTGFHNNNWTGSRVAFQNNNWSHNNSWNRNNWNHNNSWNHNNWNHNNWNHNNWWGHNNWHKNWWGNNWWNHGGNWWRYGSFWPWYSFGGWPWYYGSSYGYSYPYATGYDYSTPYVADYGYAYPYNTGNDEGSYQYDEEEPYTSDYGVGDTQTPDYMAEATSAFRGGDFGNAVRLAGHAALDDPRNPNVHLMLLLGLFAMGQYRAAASEAHAVASLGDVPTWATVYEVYGSVEPYTAQLRALEKFVRENPKSAESRFLLGFQYLMTGHREAARPQLLVALESTPRDRIAAELLTKAGGAVPPAIAKQLAQPPGAEGATTVDREPRTAARPTAPPSPEKQPTR